MRRSPDGAPTVSRFHAAPKPAVLRLEVGDHLRALFAAQRPGARQMLLRFARQARQRRATPCGRPRRAASCSGVASPSASAPTYMSSCHGASTVGAAEAVTTALRHHAIEHAFGVDQARRPRVSISPVGIMYLRYWGTTAGTVCVLEEERATVPLSDCPWTHPLSNIAPGPSWPNELTRA